LKTDIIVHGSIGAGGNHVRWLLLLDKKFTLPGDDKVEFILDKVYPSDRTYHNWLDQEWAWRVQLDTQIIFQHTCWLRGWEHRPDDFSKYNVYVTSSDAELALKLYKKFNISLNNTPENFFLDQTTNEYAESVLCRDNWHGGFIFDTVKLYTAELNKDLYQQMVDYCGLDDNYTQAKIIHEQWYRLHEKAEFESQNSLK
jgi:hypothetical protein